MRVGRCTREPADGGRVPAARIVRWARDRVRDGDGRVVKAGASRTIALGVATLLFAAASAGVLARLPLEPVQTWWFSMVALAAVPVGWAIGTTFLRTAVVGAGFFVGASAQLALTDPLWFQSIAVDPGWRWHQLLLGAIAGQAAVVVFEWARPGALARASAVTRSLGRVRLAVLVVLLLALAAPLMDKLERPLDFVAQTGLAGCFFALNAAHVLALARSLPEAGAGRLAAAWTRVAASRPAGGWVGIASGAVFVAAGALAVFAFERVPHVPDEVAYVLHAKILLTGQLSVAPPPPELLPAMGYDFLHAFRGKWFSIFPPGWPAVLALGVAAGLPALVNPLLAALSIPLAHRVFRGLAGATTASIATVLLAASPWFLATSASLMAHTLTLVLVTAAWLGLGRALQRGHVVWAFASGLAMGLLFDTRPFDGLVVGTLTGLYALLAPGRRFGLVVAYGAGCIATGALTFPYHQELIGTAWTTPIHNYFNEIWYPGANRFGFGADIGPTELWGGIDLDRGHSVWEALVHLQQNAYTLNFELLGWGVGCLSLVGVHALWGRKSRADLFAAALVAAVVGGYSFYWFAGGFYIGPRYWFMVLAPLIFWSARGVVTLDDRLRAAGARSPSPRIGLALGVLCAFALVAFTSWRGVTKYHEFRGFHDGYRRLLAEHDLTSALVFVRNPTTADFGSAYIFNSPDPSDATPRFVRDLGAERNRRVAEAYPDKRIYFVAGGDAGDRVRIVAGPLSVSDLP